MVTSDGAILKELKSPFLGSISRAALGSDRKSDRHLSMFLVFYTIDQNRTALLPGATIRFKRTFLMVSRGEAIQKGPGRFPLEVNSVRRYDRAVKAIETSLCFWWFLYN